MKAIYWGDPGGDIIEECNNITKILKKKNINMNVIPTELPPWDEKFDILFFDWGGISIGNSMLEHFCDWIIKHAEDHPGNSYIMTSIMTSAAMNDAIKELPNIPNNIYLDLENNKTLMALKCY